MATRLQQIVSAEGVAPGATVAIPHSINVRGTAWIPDRINRSNMGFAGVACTTTAVSVRNDTDAEADIELYLRLYHTEDRVYGDSATLALTPNPWWDGGAGSVVAADAPLNTFLFQPGGAAVGPEVFASFALLYAALVAARVTDGGSAPMVIGIDTSLGAASIPAGTYDLTNVTLVGVGAQPTLTFADGTVFTGLRRFENLIVSNANTTTAPITDAVDGDQFFLERAVLTSPNAGTIPVIRFGSGGGTFTVWLTEGSAIGSASATGRVLGSVGATAKTVRLVQDASSNVIAGATTIVFAAGATILDDVPSMIKIPVGVATLATGAPTLETPMSLRPNPYLGNPSTVAVTAAMGQWLRLDTGGAGANITQPLPSINAAANNLRAPGVPIMISNKPSGVTPGLGFVVIVTPAAGDTIGGGTSIQIPEGMTVLLVSNGVSDWTVIANDVPVGQRYVTPKWDGADGSVVIDNDVARAMFLGYAYKDHPIGFSLQCAWRNVVAGVGITWGEIALGYSNTFDAGTTPVTINTLGFVTVAAAGMASATTNVTSQVVLTSATRKGMPIWAIIAAANTVSAPTVLSGPVDTSGSLLAATCTTAGYRPSVTGSGSFDVDSTRQVPKQVWSY